MVSIRPDEHGATRPSEYPLNRYSNKKQHSYQEQQCRDRAGYPNDERQRTLFLPTIKIQAHRKTDREHQCANERKQYQADGRRGSIGRAKRIEPSRDLCKRWNENANPNHKSKIEKESAYPKEARNWTLPCLCNDKGWIYGLWLGGSQAAQLRGARKRADEGSRIPGRDGEDALRCRDEN